MDTINNIHLSSADAYSFLILGLFIFLLFRGFNKITSLFPLKAERQKLLTKYLPSVELLTWVFFIIGGIQHFWIENQLYSIGLLLILTVITLFILWFAFKDFVAGAIFKSNTSFSLNETINVLDYSGKIIA